MRGTKDPHLNANCNFFIIISFHSLTLKNAVEMQICKLNYTKFCKINLKIKE